jgi:hypothetical protein
LAFKEVEIDWLIWFVGLLLDLFLDAFEVEDVVALVLDTKAFAERGAVTDGAERVGRSAVGFLGISGNTMRVQAEAEVVFGALIVGKAVMATLEQLGARLGHRSLAALFLAEALALLDWRFAALAPGHLLPLAHRP